jgi:hypothetical protein
MSASTKYVSLRIELLHIKPLVWRRLMVPASISLLDLHLAIQGAMGWTNSHLHQFEIDGKSYGEPDEYSEIEIVSEKGQKLSAALGKSVAEFMYQYDFGDNWQHRIVVEQTQKVHPAWSGPLCVAGERACPPEDIGGVHGYQEFLEAIADPAHDEHVHLLKWVGGIFDPNGFDINSANERIAILFE